MRDLYLVLHIFLAAAWIGGGLSVGFLLPRMQRSGAAAAEAFFRAYDSMGKIYFNVAGIGVLVTGILLVLDGTSGYEFEDTFVVIGIIAVIIGAVLGMAGFGPATRNIVAAYENEDEGSIKTLTGRFSMLGILDTIVLLVALVAMVYKWGV